MTSDSDGNTSAVLDMSVVLIVVAGFWCNLKILNKILPNGSARMMEGKGDKLSELTVFVYKKI